MTPASTRMCAACTGEGYVVRIVGRGTMAESAVFCKFSECFLRGQGLPIVVDLADCHHLDSTFLGCLVQLHKQLAALPNGSLHLAADAEQRDRLLAALHLDRFFSLIDAAPATAENWVDLPAPSAEIRTMGQHIMECHRQLAELGGPQAEVFARIAQQLGQEIDPK